MMMMTDDDDDDDDDDVQLRPRESRQKNISHHDESRQKKISHDENDLYFFGGTLWTISNEF